MDYKNRRKIRKEFQLRNDTKLFFHHDLEYGLGVVLVDARAGDFGTVYGISADVAELVNKMVSIFQTLGVDMYFDGDVSEERIHQIKIETMLNTEEIHEIVKKAIYS